MPIEAYWNGLFDVRWEDAPLGSEASITTTSQYIEIDMKMKREALERCESPGSGRRARKRVASPRGFDPMAAQPMSVEKLCRARLPPGRTRRADPASAQHKCVLNIKRILATHPPDQFSGFPRHRRPPGLRRRTFHVQKRHKPFRRQAMTLSGLTMTRTDRQSLQIPHSQAHRSRSDEVSFGLLTRRWRTRSWCRSARFSKWRAVLALTTGGHRGRRHVRCAASQTEELTKEAQPHVLMKSGVYDWRTREAIHIGSLIVRQPRTRQTRRQLTVA